MKRFSFLLVIVLSLTTTVFFNACETDIDVSAKWKDITVVYGLISQTDSVHYLKINKAFLGDGNSLVYAQEPDSSSYFDNLEVTLTEVGVSGSTRVLTFDTTYVSDKDSGAFYSGKQLVYKSEFKVPNNLLSEDYRYNLMIRNKVTGKEITSSTNLVKDVSFKTPHYGQRNIDFISSNPNNKIIWNSAKDGRRYDVYIRFWFQEVFNTTDTTDRYIDWAIGTIKSKSLTGGEELYLTYKPDALFDISATLIPRKDGRENEVTARLTNKVDFTVVVAGDALNTYLDVNGPSSGISQDRPEYTNIVNGLGLFSSRHTQFISIPIAAQTEKVFLDKAELKSLKFVDKLGNKNPYK